MDVNRKIRIDGDYLQSYQDDYIELQVDKMNQRLTFYSIVFVILIGIAFTFSYFYIRANVRQVPEEVENLSNQVVHRMSTISERHSQMESTFQSKLSLLEKMTEAIRKDQKVVEDAVDNLKRTKADQNDVGRILGKNSQENFEAIQEVRTHLNSMNQTFTDQFNQFSSQFEAFNKDVNEIIQTSIAEIQTETQNRLNKVSKSIQTVSSEVNAFGGEVKSLEREVKGLNGSVDNLDKNLNTLDKNVNTVDKNFNALKSDLDALDKRLSEAVSSVSVLSSEITDLQASITDMINSERLEELLSIERQTIRNSTDIQKALWENHVKLLNKRIQDIEKQMNAIQKQSSSIQKQSSAIQRQSRNTHVVKPKSQKRFVQQELPIKTKKKNLISKEPVKSVYKPVERTPPPGGIIEDELRE